MTCRICKNHALDEFCSLGVQPLANSFIRKEDLKKEEKAFPLILSYCQQCGLVQLTDVVPGKLMFENYLYIPSASKTRVEHFDELSTTVTKLLHAAKKDLVVDIGSNDGSLLESFRKLNIRILGVDPSINLAKVAELKGIPTINAFFSSAVAKKIVKKYGKAKMITATNVFAHVDNIRGFVKGIEILLADDGWFVIEFPYLVDFLENCEFDTVYHEHLSYFSVRALLKLFSNTSLEIFSIKRMKLDGGALRVFVRQRKQNKQPNKEVKQLMDTEFELKLDTMLPYQRFATQVLERKKKFLTLLERLKKGRKLIIGYGAPAKGNTFLNYCKVTTKDIAYTVDSTSYKQGLFLPGSHIPIYHEQMIYTQIPDYIIILAWNFADEIMKKNAAIRKKGVKFVLPQDDFKIV